MVELEVSGRHALLFDDDAMAAFVNSPEALQQWNSLQIDRYDVRHLLQDLPPSVKRRRPAPLAESDGISLADLDRERYQDLPLIDDDVNSLQEFSGQVLAAGRNYQTVPFSYGNSEKGVPKDCDLRLEFSGFHPPFAVPESLLENLPPNEKVHQIIARTAKFVREHGGQSEIVLRVKQGDNPTFGFLMPDHHLHPYFRFLVENETHVKPPEEENKTSNGNNQAYSASGALSLLGSLYGAGEEEDGTQQITAESKEREASAGIVNTISSVNMASPHEPDTVESSILLEEDVATVKNSTAAAANENASLSKKSSHMAALTSGSTSSKKLSSKKLETENSISRSSGDKAEFSSKMGMPELESLIVEPPPYLKRMIDQTVEFIKKNGREFEAILIKQDNAQAQGKFQFLIPSNHYHPYYLKALENAQEPNISGNSLAQKVDAQGHKIDKERVKDVDLFQNDGKPLSKALASHGSSVSKDSQGTYDSERKEKFRMVIGGLKKDNVDPHLKPAQRRGGVSADEAAAIVLAATRGHMNLNKDNLFRADSGKAHSMVEDRHVTSTESLSFPYRVNGSILKLTANGEDVILNSAGLTQSDPQPDKGGKSSDVSVAKAIAKTAAIVAASEADSSEACLTREQKQKAERLKRAKMFAAMIRGGGHGGNESFLRSSLQGTASALSGSLECAGKVSIRSGSVPNATTAFCNLLSSEGDRLSREREGSCVPVDASVRDKMESEQLHDNDDNNRDRKRKKHSSRSRKHVDSDKDDKHYRKKHRTEHSSRHRKDDHGHGSHHSSHKDKEHRHRHRHRYHSSDEEEKISRSDKHRKSSRRERELEEGEVDEMVSGHSDSMEMVVPGGKFSNDHREGSLPSNVADTHSAGATEVSDELRAKVRAMLLATL